MLTVLLVLTVVFTMVKYIERLVCRREDGETTTEAIQLSQRVPENMPVYTRKDIGN